MQNMGHYGDIQDALLFWCCLTFSCPEKWAIMRTSRMADCSCSVSHRVVLKNGPSWGHLGRLIVLVPPHPVLSWKMGHYGDIHLTRVVIKGVCCWLLMSFNNLATGFWPPSATVVSAEPFSHGMLTLRCLQKEMGTYRHWSVSLWRDPDDVPHCWILSPDKTGYTLWMKTVFRGWPIMVYETHMRRRRRLTLSDNVLGERAQGLRQFVIKSWKLICTIFMKFSAFVWVFTLQGESK